MLVAPNRLLNPVSGGEAGIVITDAGRAVANTYANKPSGVNIDPGLEYPFGNFWFRLRNDVSWSGTRCLFAAHVIGIDAVPYPENRWVSITVFKATPTSTSIFLTYTFTFISDQSLYFTGSTVMSPAVSEQWHMINWWSDPLSYANGCVFDGTLLGVDDDLQVGVLNDYYQGVHELNQSQIFIQGGTWFINGAVADYADVWVDKRLSGTGDLDQTWKKFATNSGKPKNLGIDGSLPYGTVPQSYLRTWPGGTTLVNSGSAGNWSVSGTNFTLTSGPSQWGV